MIVEIPNFKRCCCCMPLRGGILVFAYLNLIITIFFGVLHILLWIIIFNNAKDYTIGMYRGVVIESEMFFVIFLHVLDVIFNIVLIVGAHKKNITLMKIYYYYQLTTLIASLLALIVTYSDNNSGWMAVISELAVAFLGFVIQIYLLLLIHSELKKQRYQEGRSSFVNQMSEVCLEPTVRIDRRNFL